MEKVTTYKDVMPAQAGIRRPFCQAPAFAGVTLLLLLFSLPALAAEDAKTVTYAPEYCEFAVTFPGEPYTVQRCDEDDSKKCYNLVSYTQVYEMAATVNFRVICSKIDESVYKNYSPEVMAATLRAMTDRTVIKAFDTTFREEEGYKQAGLVGEGRSGRSATLYIAQLWIGGHSAFSLEAEMIGEKNDDADKLFSDVLKSVHYTVNDKKEEEKKEEPKEEKEKPESEKSSE